VYEQDGLVVELVGVSHQISHVHVAALARLRVVGCKYQCLVAWLFDC
jgi:hypothetical protein